MAASILVLVFLVLVLVAVAVLMLKLCKKRVNDKQRRAALNTSVAGIDNGTTKMSPQMTSLSAAKV